MHAVIYKIAVNDYIKNITEESLPPMLLKVLALTLNTFISLFLQLFETVLEVLFHILTWFPP